MGVFRGVFDSTELLQRLEQDTKLNLHNGCVNTIGKDFKFLNSPFNITKYHNKYCKNELHIFAIFMQKETVSNYIVT